MNPEIAKVSVEKFNSDEQFLYKFEKNIGLFENVKQICKRAGLPESHVYGLKFLPTEKNPSATHYISEINYENINHNDNLKIVFSIEYITNRIITNLNDEDLRSLSFKNLSELCLDPVFIEELVKDKKHKTLIECYINDHMLTTEERLPLLITLVQLFQKQHVRDTSQDFLQTTLDLLKCENTTPLEIQHTLSLLQKILVSKDHDFDSWKMRIIKNLPITEIIPCIWSENNNADLQYSAVLLINTIISLCKDQKKVSLIKEMNSRINRENVYEYIIKKGCLSKEMEHELYVLQTYIFSLHTEALRPLININNNTLFNKDEFELSRHDLKRITILMDFDEHPSNKRMSVESVLSGRWDNSELSLNSIVTNDEPPSNRSSMDTSLISLRKKRKSDVNEECLAISQVTLDCLRHYKRHHSNTFRQSQIEEYLYEPGIFVTSERVVQMLAKILHIGVDNPDAKSTFYQPTAFYCVPNCSPKTPFLWELFAITMWLMSRTRREMKASTFEDYSKVMTVLKKQIKMALKLKPLTIKGLTEELCNTSFQSVMEQIQKEKEQEFKKLTETHPCVIELKQELTKTNEKYIYDHRINCLLNGAHFPKVLEKKVSGNIFVKLRPNFKDIMVYDVTDVKIDKMEFVEKFKVDDITHVVVGKNCKHSNLCMGHPNLAFSIFVNNEEKIRFIAKDEVTANYWTDALSLLTSKCKLSENYTSELNDLVEMDLRLKLMDLQNVEIPKLPPPVPPLPDEEVTPTPSPRRSRRYLK